MVRLSLALIAMVAACDLGTVPITGGPGPGPNPGVDAGTTPGTTGIQSFTTSVYPILQGQCVGCHEAGGNANFCAATATGAYSAIIALPSVVGTFVASTAPVLTKVAGGHNGTAYTAANINAITTWLNLEKAARP